MDGEQLSRRRSDWIVGGYEDRWMGREVNLPVLTVN